MLKKLTIATLALLVTQGALAADPYTKEQIQAIEKITTVKIFETPEIFSEKGLARIDEQKVFSKEEQEAIKTIVHNYIIDNPEILLEVHKRLDAKVKQEQEQLLQDRINFIKNDPNIPTFGDKDAENYVIEFSDYNCGYCKVAKEYIDQFVKEYNARIMYVELPILSPMSVKAAAFAIALYKKDKELFLKYNNILMSQKGKVTKDDDIRKVIRNIGEDYDALDAMISKDKILDILVTNIKLSQAMGIRGTPFYIINGKTLAGAVRNYDDLKQAVGLK